LTKVIFIFVDGFGLGEKDPAKNPCAQKGIELLALFQNSTSPVSIHKGGFLVPTEATLGIAGLPQSATGQATLFTGINCSKLLGRHLQGFPNEKLREVLRQKSILRQIINRGLQAIFINAYRPIFFKLNEKTQWRLSTTTVATLSANLPFFQIADIRSHHSIYHDFTNEALISKGFDVPRFSPSDAARILAKTSEKVDFVLYEYFLTDRAGHSQKMADAFWVLQLLEQFLSALLKEVNLKTTLVIITSDHGNMEDLSVKTHTRNPIMTLLWGKQSSMLINKIRTLEDITPAVLSAMG